MDRQKVCFEEAGKQDQVSPGESAEFGTVKGMLAESQTDFDMPGTFGFGLEGTGFADWTRFVLKLGI
jgi:hypothetical protein